MRVVRTFFVAVYWISFSVTEAWLLKPLKAVTPRHQQPVQKVPKEPVLIVNDRLSGSRITLVGVSHGSPSSAKLVLDTIKNSEPSAVVLELCDDRFLSLSLEAQLRPTENSTLINRYDELYSKIQERKAESSVPTALGPVAKLYGLFQFARGQGIVGGLFVAMGFLVNNLQKLAASSSEDEFTTAMREAYKLSIPIRMGDADQNATLNSLKGLLSQATFNPSKVSQGARLLAFSTFGLFPTTSYKSLADTIDPKVMKESKWVNIPTAYMENKALFSTIIPIVLASVLPYVFLLPSFDPPPTETVQALKNVGDTPLVESMIYLNSLPIFSELGGAMAAASQLLSEDNFSILADIGSVLLLIRMAKIVGTDRDAIIASKVQKIAREFKGKDIVVVVGMLHCNGVARWLLSGQDPEVAYLKDE